MKTAISTLKSAGQPVNIGKVCEQVADIIINSYDHKTSSFVYKTAWCRKIGQVLKDMNIKYSSSKPNWEYIAMAINDQRLGLHHYAPQAYQTTDANSCGSSSTTTTATVTATVQSLSSESASTNTKQSKLCAEDKDRIKNLFDSLNKNKMWKLSTGTFV